MRPGSFSGCRLTMRTVFLALTVCMRSGMPCVASETKEHPEWKSYFEASGGAGTIVLTDLVREETHVYNPQRAAETFIPASTYKIPHSLITLETGVVKDENQTFKLEGQERQVESWNRS